MEEYLAANRLLARHGMKTKYSIMLGFPEETMEDVIASVNIALRVLDENPFASFNPFYVFQPYPGTRLATQYKVKGYDGLEQWGSFGRHNLETPFVGGRRGIFDNIMFSSKYVGRLFPNMFPDDPEVARFAEELKAKWRAADFDSPAWKELRSRHQTIITRLFGANAY